MANQLKLKDLLNLAFASPDQEVVNIKYLHAVLLGLVQSSNLEHVVFELKGNSFCSKLSPEAPVVEPALEISEYDAARNEKTGCFEKKSQIKVPEAEVTNIWVIRDCQEQACESSVSPLFIDPLSNVVRGDEYLDERLRNLESGLKSLESAVQKSCSEDESALECPDSVAEVPECPRNSYSSDCSASRRDLGRPSTSEDCCCQSSVDKKMKACMAKMCADLEVLKRDLCRTQKCVKRLQDEKDLIATLGEESDIKFEELTNMVNGVIETVRSNCDSIECLKQESKELENRICLAFEEQETLFRVKADKEEMDRRLDEKADRTELELKVDVDVFNCVKSELSDAILDAHQQIKALTARLEQCVCDIMSCLRTKVDNATFESFVKCIEKRVRIIACETQRWINMKKAEVCPFTRMPFMPNQCCGVCNQPVVIRGIESPVPKMPCLSSLAWNNNAKLPGPPCRRAGGQHTVTTPCERLCSRGKFQDVFATHNDCQPVKHELDFPGGCLQDLLSESEKC